MRNSMKFMKILSCLKKWNCILDIRILKVPLILGSSSQLVDFFKYMIPMFWVLIQIYRLPFYVFAISFHFSQFDKVPLSANWLSCWLYFSNGAYFLCFTLLYEKHFFILPYANIDVLEILYPQRPIHKSRQQWVIH